MTFNASGTGTSSTLYYGAGTDRLQFFVSVQERQESQSPSCRQSVPER